MFANAGPSEKSGSLVKSTSSTARGERGNLSQDYDPPL